MNILVIQNDIVNKLQTAFNEATLPFKSFDLPDVPNDVQKAVAAPIVYVAYMGSSADASVDTRIVAQSRKLKFNVEVQSRRMNGANGLFVARDAVEQTLIGYAPANCKKLYLVEDSVSQTEDNMWVHVYHFEAQTMLVQKEESDPVIVPSFQEITNN